MIGEVNHSTNDLKLPKIKGHYKPGYLYGIPKVHESIADPPLRRIIFQIGTSTYKIAKTLNSILKDKIPDKFSINSPDRFFDEIRPISSKGLIA